METICEHQYEPIKKITPKLDNKYVSSNQWHQTAILNLEEIYIFCNKCWDSKKIDLTLN